MAKWQQKYRLEWDATNGRNRGAQRTVWEVFMEMDRYRERAGREDQGAVVLVLDLAKAFERVRLPVVWAWGNALQLPKEDLASAVRILRAPVASAVRRMCGGAALDHHGHLARVEVELRASAHCAADASPLKSRVFVDEITAFVIGRNKAVAEMGKKVMRRLMRKLKKRA